MGMLDTPRIHPSAGVARGSQPLADAFDTFHITYRKGGMVQTGRVKLARNPMRSAAQQRRAAMHSAAFKFDVPMSKVDSAVNCG